MLTQALNFCKNFEEKRYNAIQSVVQDLLHQQEEAHDPNNAELILYYSALEDTDFNLEEFLTQWNSFWKGKLQLTPQRGIYGGVEGTDKYVMLNLHQ